MGLILYAMALMDAGETRFIPLLRQGSILDSVESAFQAESLALERALRCLPETLQCEEVSWIGIRQEQQNASEDVCWIMHIITARIMI